MENKYMFSTQQMFHRFLTQWISVVHYKYIIIINIKLKKYIELIYIIHVLSNVVYDQYIWYWIGQLLAHFWIIGWRVAQYDESHWCSVHTLINGIYSEQTNNLELQVVLFCVHHKWDVR